MRILVNVIVMVFCLILAAGFLYGFWMFTILALLRSRVWLWALGGEIFIIAWLLYNSLWGPRDE